MINKKLSSLLIAVILLCSFTTTFAVGDQFEISATVTASSDTTPPSTPTGLTATAVSTSQIDLSWTASTDNVAVTGYKIYRDNVFINTASGTTYSDTGLNHSTTYAYVVSATDAASNESTRSSTSTATTFTPSTAGGGNGGGSTSGQFVYPIIYDLKVETTQTGATVSWKTTTDTIDNLSWGLTNNYELGTSVGALYETSHSANITGLLAGTKYYFGITATNGYGVMVTLQNQNFVTKPIPEGELNATDFLATPRQKDILLTWKNPVNENFEEVRIVRSKNFFPTDPNDGQIVYEGASQTEVDSDVEIGTTYFYTLFAKSKDGTYSSGLLSSARIPLPGEPVVPVGDVFDTIPQALNVHPQIQSLTFLDFDFIQDGRKIAQFQNGDSVTINGNKNLTVLLDSRKVPDVLKSIVITLVHPEDTTKTFSFLLRINEEKTFYSATIGPLGQTGNYGVKISIVDYKNQGLKRIFGNLLATAGTGADSFRGLINILVRLTEEKYINLLLLIILLAITTKSVHSVGRKKKKKESSQSETKSNQLNA